MKELSIEQKAKAYDEAIERARLSRLQLLDIGVEATEIEYIFPELRESEDKQIIKEIAEFIYNSAFKPKDLKKKEKWLTWLEKQCEQKPVENVNGDDYGIDGLWHAITILEETLGEVDGYQSDDGILEHKCAITAVRDLAKKQREQNPVEWSDEDERIRNGLINRLTRISANTRTDSTSVNYTFSGEIEWLKNLHSQPKQKQNKKGE